MQQGLNDSLDLYLVNVPLGMLYSPSLALGLLKASANNAGVKTRVLYSNVILANVLGLDNYRSLSNIGNFTNQLIEVLFQPYVGYEEYSSMDEIEKFFNERYDSLRNIIPDIRREFEKAWEKMDYFLDLVSDIIISANPKVVGCSNGFQQANASFAILKRVKEKRPDIITIMGGSSCSGTIGQSIVDYIDQVDYVFCGESDDIFPDAIKLMIDGDTDGLANKHPWVLKRGGRPCSHAMMDMDKVPYPDYDDYFEQIEEYGLKDMLEISIPVESSRGCWWGCMHRCKFCGLHLSNDTIKYRKKSLNRIHDELEYLYDKYKAKMFFFCDCILDNEYIKEFPKIIDGEKMRCYAEIKSNLNFNELLSLRKAGFRWVQPGIEAIQDDLLIHMNKGNRAIKHLEYLKMSTGLGLVSFWNLITGFPMEKEEWYEETMNIIPLITHFYPPNRNTLIYQRNSEYTTEHEKYGVTLRISDCYSYFFGKNTSFHEGFAEYFDVENRKQPYLEKLDEFVTNWTNEWQQGSRLTYFVDGDFLGIFDSRKCATDHKLVLDGLDKDICILADNVVSIKSVIKELSQYGYSESDIVAAIDGLIEQKLIIRIKDEILFLAINRDLQDTYPMEMFYGSIKGEEEILNG